MRVFQNLWVHHTDTSDGWKENYFRNQGESEAHAEYSDEVEHFVEYAAVEHERERYEYLKKNDTIRHWIVITANALAIGLGLSNGVFSAAVFILLTMSMGACIGNLLRIGKKEL